jgi:hypothetical protein
LKRGLIAMHFHIHMLRHCSGALLSLSPALALLLMVQRPDSAKFEGATVIGRVTYEDRPVSGMMICFSLPDKPHVSYGMLAPDGSFRLQTNRTGDGAAPGTYRVHFHFPELGSWLPEKFTGPEIPDLVLDVSRGWNHCAIDLR